MELKDKQVSLQEMSSECGSIKQLHKVEKSFFKGTNSSSWEDAMQKCPNYCTATQLEPFKKLNFSSSVLPERFSKGWFLQILEPTIMSIIVLRGWLPMIHF